MNEVSDFLSLLNRIQIKNVRKFVAYFPESETGADISWTEHLIRDENKNLRANNLMEFSAVKRTRQKNLCSYGARSSSVMGVIVWPYFRCWQSDKCAKMRQFSSFNLITLTLITCFNALIT